MASLRNKKKAAAKPKVPVAPVQATAGVTLSPENRELVKRIAAMLPDAAPYSRGAGGTLNTAAGRVTPAPTKAAQLGAEQPQSSTLELVDQLMSRCDGLRSRMNSFYTSLQGVPQGPDAPNDRGCSLNDHLAFCARMVADAHDAMSAIGQAIGIEV